MTVVNGRVEVSAGGQIKVSTVKTTAVEIVLSHHARVCVTYPTICEGFASNRE